MKSEYSNWISNGLREFWDKATVLRLAHAIQLAPPRASASLKQYCLLLATAASLKTVALSQNSLQP